MTLGDTLWLAALAAAAAGLLDGAARSLGLRRAALAAGLAVVFLSRGVTVSLAGRPLSLGDWLLPAALGAGWTLADPRRGHAARAAAAGGTAVLLVAGLAGGWPGPPVGAAVPVLVCRAWGAVGRRLAGASLLALSLAPWLPVWSHGLAPPQWPLGSGGTDDLLAVAVATLLSLEALEAAWRGKAPRPVADAVNGEGMP